MAEVLDPANRAPREDAALVDYHLNRLYAFRRKNRLKEAYYEGKQRVKALGANLPANMRDFETAVGWASTAVDVLEERLDWQGWTSEDGNLLGLDKVFVDNDLDVDSGLATIDSLVSGVGFVIVGRGEPDDPEVLVTIESPNFVTGEWDARKRRLSSALSIDSEENGDAREVTLYLPDKNVRYQRTMFGWYVIDTDRHGYGRVTVVALPNRPRGSRSEGRSEITAAVRGYTDDAVRTLLGMSVHREFYQAPQRYALGTEQSMFQKADGTVATGWETIMGRMLALPRDEDGELPEVGQFSASSPTPYLEQLRGLAQMFSAEAAIPQNYLGFSSDNPPSADAIRAMEARLIKRAERRQKTLGRGWREVGALALLVRDGVIPEEFAKIGTGWRDAATPTRSAAADEVSKYVAAGTLPADSEVTYDRMGLSPAEKKTLAAEKRRAAGRATLDALTQQAPPPGAPTAEEPPRPTEAAAA